MTGQDKRPANGQPGKQKEAPSDSETINNVQGATGPGVVEGLTGGAGTTAGTGMGTEVGAGGGATGNLAHNGAAGAPSGRSQKKPKA